MGLDQFVYRMSKVGRDTLKQLNGKNEKDIDFRKFLVISQDEADWHPDMYSDIKDILSPVYMIYTFVNITKIRQDYEVPEDWEIGMKSYGGGEVTYGFRKYVDKEWKTKSVTLTDDELKKYLYDEEIPSYICYKKEVHYMRKEYDIDDAMSELYDGTLENCGYHRMNVDMIDTLNELSGKKILNPDATNLYYHQWY